MRDRPDAHDLLTIAREELMQRVLPALPPSARYEALMIANAMAIAAREIESGHANETRELQGLRQLLNDQDSMREAGMPPQLEDCRRQLRMAIRAGRFDPDQPGHRTMLQHLRATAGDKVLVSNPKLLAKAAK